MIVRNRLFFNTWIIFNGLIAPVQAETSPIKTDETVMFFPTLACFKDQQWQAHVHGWIYEPAWWDVDGIEDPQLIDRIDDFLVILIGDSGEQDPEIYAALAHQYPRQIIKILIRDITGEGVQTPRYLSVFKDLPASLWHVFREATALPTDLTALLSPCFPKGKTSCP